MQWSVPVWSCIDKSFLANSAASKTLDEEKHAMYRTIIRCFMYISTRSRPDFVAVASMLAPYLHEPKLRHVIAAIRKLSYLNGTKERGLLSKPGDSNQLTTIADANWGSSHEREKRSRSGMKIKFGDVVVAGPTNLQKFVSLSSPAMEYVALNDAVKVIVWLWAVLAELGVK